MEKIPGHHHDEMKQGTILLLVAGVISLIIFIHLAQFAPSMAVLLETGFNQNGWNTAASYMTGFYSVKSLVENARFASSIAGFYVAVTFLITLAISALPLIIALARNPYRMFPLIHGDARKGNDKDIRMMEDRKQVGINGGKFLHLGSWPNTKEPMRLIETLSALVLAPPGTGKCLAPHEKIRMADGSVGLNGDLRVGSQVMGPDGRPRNVLHANRGYGPMFRVTPNKGRPWECNGDHILVLRKSRQPLKGLEREVTVNEWLTWTDWQKSEWKLFRAEMEFPAQSTPKIDPYFVGLLLGDGTTTAKIGIHTADKIIADQAYAMAERYGLQVRPEYQPGNASVFYAVSAGNQKGLPRKGKNPLRDEIFSAGLRASCGEKSIPVEYKMGSRATRLEVLAGIIDTDGSYDRKGKGYDVVSKSEQLIDDVAFVARSLGLAAYPKPCEKTATNTGAKGTYHRIFISGDVTIIPVRLDRRIPQRRQMNKEVTNVGFDIEPIGNGEWHGIILDGDHKFLLDDLTVTHNTASFVVPSIVDTDSSSFIVNDPKPELFALTSGHRAQIGHVLMIDWSATDKIDPLALDDPEKTVFYARFNPLSPKLLPPQGTADRDTYLDAIASVMSPSGKGGGNADYFEQKGRAALVGFLHYICSKVADTPEGQAPNLTNIPTYWHRPNIEPSIPMLIDLITEGQHAAGKKNDEEKQAAAAEGKFHQGDALSDWLKAIVEECIENEYSPRAITEITPLVNMAPNERSGILGTMDKAFLPFKNAAVRERTSSCDFVPADLRGMGPNGETTGPMKPVTLYVCVNQATASAFATITSLLYEVLSREYLAYGPEEKNLNGRILGPYPICFMLDEFAKLPRIEAVMTGPDLGRSKNTMYCLVAQSDAQIGKLYSKEDQQIIYATTAIKYILPQNDKDTIKLVQDMVGPTTAKRNSRSRTRGGDMKEWGKSNESQSLDKIDFIRPGDVSGMKPGTHILICQGFMNRPYFMESVFFFKEPEMLAKVYNPRTGLGPKPCYPVPEFVRQKRIEEWKALNPDKVGQIQEDRTSVERSRYEDSRELITA